MQCKRHDAKLVLFLELGLPTVPFVLPIFARPEKCQSGRMGLTRNQVYLQGYRGFESLLLRQSPVQWGLGFFVAGEVGLDGALSGWRTLRR